MKAVVLKHELTRPLDGRMGLVSVFSQKGFEVSPLREGDLGLPTSTSHSAPRPGRIRRPNIFPPKGGKEPSGGGQQPRHLELSEEVSPLIVRDEHARVLYLDIFLDEPRGKDVGVASCYDGDFRAVVILGLMLIGPHTDLTNVQHGG